MKTEVTQLFEQFESLKDQMVEIRHHLHMHPELSLQEYETSKFIRKTLDEAGIAYDCLDGRSVVARIIGSASAISTGKGKTLGIRSDMDALPILEAAPVPYASKNTGVMHACGHDTHTTMALISALILQKNRQLFHGEVRVLFQEAEEVMAGAMKVMASGLLDGVDNFIGLHVDPHSDVGKFVTSKGFRSAKGARITIDIEGKSGHSSLPRLAHNPIVASAHIIHAVSAMINGDPHIGTDIVCTPTIISGGGTSNIIPATAQIVYDSRYYENRFDDYLLKRFSEVAWSAAQSVGCSAQVNVEASGEPMVNVPEFVDRGVKVLEGLWGEHCIEIEPPGLFGDDFAFILKEIPGAMFSIGTAVDNAYYNAHNENLIIPDDFMQYGVKFLLAFAMDYLGD